MNKRELMMLQKMRENLLKTKARSSHPFYVFHYFFLNFYFCNIRVSFISQHAQSALAVIFFYSRKTVFFIFCKILFFYACNCFHCDLHHDISFAKLLSACIHHCFALTFFFFFFYFSIKIIVVKKVIIFLFIQN